MDLVVRILCVDPDLIMLILCVDLVVLMGVRASQPTPQSLCDCRLTWLLLVRERECGQIIPVWILLGESFRMDLVARVWILCVDLVAWILLCGSCVWILLRGS